jgi:exodeoxyribonuclease VIII
MKPTPINQSGLKLYRRSPAWYKYNTDNPPAPSDTQVFGSAYHCYILEPFKFPDKYFVFDPSERPEKDKTMASNANKAWKQSLMTTDKIILDMEDFNKIQMMADVLINHPTFKALMTDGQYEQLIELDDFKGCPVHGRPDFYNDKFILDLKTCYNASPKDFSKHASPYGYHIQAAFYTDILAAVDGKDRMFIFVAQETEAPYMVAFYVASDQMIAQGRWEYDALLKQHITCCEADQWRGYESDDEYGINELYLPAWAIGE